MTGLFHPDLFSVQRPQFSPVHAATAAHLQPVWSSFGINDDVLAIEQAGGNEINSHNFMVRTTGESYLLKRMRANSTLDSTTRGLRLLQWLQDQSVPVPGVFASVDGELVVEHDGSLFGLLSFIPGEFFHGGDEELTETAHAIGRLHRTLVTLPPALQPVELWNYDFSEAPGLLAEARTAGADWPAWFDAAAAALLEDTWPQIEKLARELADGTPPWAHRPWGAGHADLHPHNLLVRNKRVAAFVDFDAFSRIPAAAALGFAFYKVTRQWASALEPEQRDSAAIAAGGERFLRGLEAGAEGTLPDVRELKSAACAEIFRRLLLILRLNVRESNRTWNHVLTVHLAGLAEADAIFDRLPAP